MVETLAILALLLLCWMGMTEIRLWILAMSVDRLEEKDKERSNEFR